MAVQRDQPRPRGRRPGPRPAPANADRGGVGPGHRGAVGRAGAAVDPAPRGDRGPEGRVPPPGLPRGAPGRVRNHRGGGRVRPVEDPDRGDAEGRRVRHHRREVAPDHRRRGRLPPGARARRRRPSEADGVLRRQGSARCSSGAHAQVHPPIRVRAPDLRPRRRACGRGQGAGRGRRRERSHPRVVRRGAADDRGPDGGCLDPRAGPVPGVRPGAAGVWEADRPAPGRGVHARRHGRRDRLGEVAAVPGVLGGRARLAVPVRPPRAGRRCEAGVLRDGRAGPGPRRAGPRRPRVHAREPGGATVARGSGGPDLGGDQRDPASHPRERADEARPPGVRGVAHVSGADPAVVAELLHRERAAFVERHPRSRELFERGRASLLGGVPMTWMLEWAGGFPVFMQEAFGSRVRDVDGHTYVDLCLGDTGAMTGHAPPAAVAAIAERMGKGVTAMLPTEDAIWVGEELTRRFGVSRWQFTLTATDANRFAIRIAREISGRPKILVFNYCYHGTVDETFITLDEAGKPRSREGNVGPPVDPTTTTEVVEFNDVGALGAALGMHDVACVLTEPALTNIGIVLPETGFHEALRDVTRRTGTLLIIDETHTISAGPGGSTGAHGLEPDVVTIGKPIGSGVPSGAFGVTEEVAERMFARTGADYQDVGGIGGTLAGNALSLAAMRGTLERVLTHEGNVIAEHGAPWHVTGLGCRAEYLFQPEPPRNGGQAAARKDPDLDALVHVYLLNRGILMTPFHNMALMSPAITEADVDAHTEAFAAFASDVLS